MIETCNVSKWFGPTLAVNDVSVQVERGEVLGFLGPNGAGKSTTMRLITGFLPISSGTITVEGHDIETDTIAAKEQIGYLPENAPAYPEMTVQSFLSFVAELRGKSGKERQEMVERVIKTCFLESVRHQTIDTLSKGYRHRTCFAQSILHDPPVLILDEPTDGLDPNQKHEVRNLIKSMGEKKAIIVSTHILEEVDAICSRVAIIDRGSIVFNGTPDALRQRSEMAGSVTIRILDQDATGVKTELAGCAGVQSVRILDTTGSSVLARVFPDRESATAESSLAATVAAGIKAKGWSFDELHSERGRLDEVFRAITIPDTVQEERP